MMMKIIRLSLTTYIVIGLVLGILVGLFFGESCADLGIIGTAFVRLVQMTIIPYLMTSLILGFGKMDYTSLKILAIKGGAVFFLFLVIGIIYLMFMPLVFPSWESASFFNPDITKPEEKIDLLSQFIPANPIEAMSKNAVPAVVLFSLFIGVALIGVKDKETLLRNVAVLAEVFTRISHFLIKLTPIGVFAITASVAGTLTLGELSKLQVYSVTYVVSAVFLSIVLVPLITATLTPFRYRDIMRVSKDALVTSFATGSLLIALPLLTESCKTLFREYQAVEPNTDSMVDSLIPVAFNFPTLGKMLSLFFLFFAAWYAGKQIDVADYPYVLSTAIPVYFGSVNVALPFLMQLYQIPLEIFDLFIVSGVMNGRFATLLACMHLIAFTLLATYAITLKIKINWKRLIVHLGTVISLVFILILSLGGVFQASRRYFLQ